MISNGDHTNRTCFNSWDHSNVYQGGLMLRSLQWWCKYQGVKNRVISFFNKDKSIWQSLPFWFFVNFEIYVISMNWLWAGLLVSLNFEKRNTIYGIRFIFSQMRTIGCNPSGLFYSFNWKIPLICLKMTRLKYYASMVNSQTLQHSVHQKWGFTFQKTLIKLINITSGTHIQYESHEGYQNG